VVLGAGFIVSAGVPTGPHRPGVHEFIGLASFVSVLLALPILARGMAHQPSLAAPSTLGRWAAAVAS
jgi:predicted exporter